MPKSKSETTLEIIMKQNGIQYSRSGYPDYAALDRDGKIYGFIEVKRNKDDLLRTPQELFRKFCLDRDIPHTVWIPGSKLPEWLRDIADDNALLSEVKMLDMKTAAELLVREWLLKESREVYSI